MTFEEAQNRYRFIFALAGIILILFFVSGMGCQQSPVASWPAESFAYTGFDTSGNVIVMGYISIVMIDSAHLTGRWQFSPIGQHHDIGPQTGGDSLRGEFSEGKLVISLNPGWVDNNVFLIGTYSTASYRGEWTYTSFRGPTNHGTFEATKNMK